MNPRILEPFPLFEGPFLQALIIGPPADPLPRFLIKIEGDASTETLVIFTHQFCIGLIMPDLKLRYIDPCFLFQPLNERFHLVAVRSLGPCEFHQIKLRLNHDHHLLSANNVSVSIMSTQCLWVDRIDPTYLDY
jgi:hypothetical protein